MKLLALSEDIKLLAETGPEEINQDLSETGPV